MAVTFRALVAEAPAILRVEEGEKRLAFDGQSAVIPGGALCLLPGGVPMEVENRPGPSGRYAATVLAIPPGVACPEGPRRALFSRRPAALDAFDRAVTLHRRAGTPQAIRAHAVAEVLIWLAEDGVILPKSPPTVVERLRRVLAADLARDWTAADAGRVLAMSEATLRRRLAEAGTGFADTLADLRMTRALGLLQGSDLSVAAVAAEVGYASASRFAARFRARFGIAPGNLRGRQPVPAD